jgi:glycosyltransferase involved in cell wall biosynthesis
MTFPLVSIITPSFNQGRFLEAAISSVLDQDYAPIEYIVIDGDSKDESSEVIQKYAKRLAYWESQPDRGQAHAINKGLVRASGEILGWLNSDDILLPGTVRKVVEIYNQFPEVDVVYGRLERIDEDGLIIPTPLLPKDRVEFSKDLILGECVVNQPGSFWRREAMDHAGLLSEDLHYALDYDYWIRMALAGARFKRLPDVLARFRLSSGSKTVGQTAKMAEEYLQVLEKTVSRSDITGVLGLTKAQVQQQADKTRARIFLQGFYGEIKLGHRRQALNRLVKALRCDPGVVFERRWLGLGLAGFRRRILL